MTKIGSIPKEIIDKYNIPCDDLDVHIHKGALKHISKRHPEIKEPEDIIKEVLEKPDYIGQHPTEINSLECVKKINDNYLVAIKIDTKTSKFIVATTYPITEAKLLRNISLARLAPFNEIINSK